MPSNWGHAIACGHQLAVAEEGPRARREEIGGSSRMSWLYSTGLRRESAWIPECDDRLWIFGHTVAKSLRKVRGRAIQREQRTVYAKGPPRWAVVRTLDEVQGRPGRTEPCCTICEQGRVRCCGGVEALKSKDNNVQEAGNKSTRSLLYNAHGGRVCSTEELRSRREGPKRRKPARSNADGRRPLEKHTHTRSAHAANDDPCGCSKYK